MNNKIKVISDNPTFRFFTINDNFDTKDYRSSWSMSYGPKAFLRYAMVKPIALANDQFD